MKLERKAEMIEITKTDVYGFEAAIRGMRNPMNSWDKSDSKKVGVYINGEIYPDHSEISIGKNDFDLIKHLVNAGSDHRKFLRMIIVSADILAPLYWWKEYDTYKVGTVANSCSTMHKIHEKPFTLDDFSHEQLFGSATMLNENNTADSKEELLNRGLYDIHMEWNEDGIEWWEGNYAIDALCEIIVALNEYRKRYLETMDKRYWWQLIQLLPSSYNQLRTVQLNYEVLYTIYFARKDHKLDEWHTFCDWIKSLPYMNHFLAD